MILSVSFPRLWFAAGLLLSLGACALPRNGPDYHEITAAAPQDLEFDVVRVTRAVTAATRIDERSGFASAIPSPSAKTPPMVDGTKWKSSSCFDWHIHSLAALIVVTTT